MKIIDSFLFSMPHEKNVLLAKLHAEYDCVDEFIGLESDYDFRGNYKGHHLLEVLHSDSRFDRFLDKIFIITDHNGLLPDGDKNEKQYFKAEFSSRELCWNYVKSKHQDGDWLILSDVDEMLDFSDKRKRDILLDGFKTNTNSIQWKNLKYWWGYSNLNLDPDKFIPCHKIGALKERENPFWHRNNHCKRLEPGLDCGLEFAYSFDISGNWNKLNTFAHDKYRYETLENALKFNTWHREEMRNEHISHPLHFFETIDIDENNSTKFVLENFHSIDPKIVDKDYAENRVNFMGVSPHPCLQYNLMRGYKINRKCYYYAQ